MDGKLYCVNKSAYFNGLHLEAGDYVFAEDLKNPDGEIFAVKKDDIHGRRGDLLLGYHKTFSENWRTKKKSVVWEDCTVDVTISRLVWNDFFDKKYNKYSGMNQCRKNSMPKRGKCRPLTRSRNSFDGMVPLSYGEQCISQTFESRRNTVTYNAEIM